MAKQKGSTAAPGATARADAAGAAPAFEEGQRVQVLAGEYCNARGHVVYVGAREIGVAVSRTDIVPFEPSNLRHLPPQGAA